mmetsp:Transcript_103935/g.270610  ORF Transcript_103935/g.270610 Transcript_103935/m.270610 type:complete len:254 (-) Transcript_103935:2-763(-)
MTKAHNSAHGFGIVRGEDAVGHCKKGEPGKSSLESRIPTPLASFLTAPPHNSRARHSQAWSHCRSPLGGLLVDVVGNIIDVVGAQLLTEGRHGVLAVGDLGHDGCDAVAAREVLLKRIFLEFLLRDDSVVAARVAGRAVAVEDALAVLQVGGQSRLATGDRDEEAEGRADGERAPSGGLGLHLGSRELLECRRGHGTCFGRCARGHRRYEAARAIHAESGGGGEAGDAGHGDGGDDWSETLLRSADRWSTLAT